MFMTVTDDSGNEKRGKVMNYCLDCFNQAIELSPTNVAAELNRALLLWYVGELRDD